MEAPVETVNKRTEVTGSVFGEIECMISATQADFEVAKNRIDQLNSGNSLGLRPSATIAASINNPGKATQPIGSDYTIWREVSGSPVKNCFASKTRDQCHFNIQGTAFGTERDGRHKRHLVLGASACLAASQFSAKVTGQSGLKRLENRNKMRY